MPSSKQPFLAGEAELGGTDLAWPPSPCWAVPAPRVCGIHRKVQHAGEGQRAGQDKDISGKSESSWCSAGWERWECCPSECLDSSSLSQRSQTASALPGQGQGKDSFSCWGAAELSEQPGSLPPLLLVLLSLLHSLWEFLPSFLC